MRKPFIFALLLLLFTHIAYAQSPTITLNVQAGFNGYFRDSQWTPVIIQAANSGDDASGRLVVRPETSGAGLLNTYSTPITLARGAQQTAFLYITARSFTTSIRVEMIDNDGNVIAQQDADLHSIQDQDELSVVVSDSPIGSVDLTGVHAANDNGYQADWKIADLPTQGLDSVNLMLISDIDSSTLSSAQKQAISDWIAAGGHLIVTGGQNWQGTAAGVGNLLPITPSGSKAVDGLQPLGNWLHDSGDLSAQTVVATGTVNSGGQVIAAAADGTPLLVRRTLGAGVVDYLAADPNNAPLRGWNGLPDLWFTLATNNNPQPGWGGGFVNWNSAESAAEILPGYDPLPDILPLCGFLALYIALIGPLNYLVLNRINRREWAWITIPLFILAFSVLSYGLGFNLRGNEATLNRLAVVQTWNDSDRAHVDELVGLLSPRRTEYTLTAPADTALRPIPNPPQTTGLLTQNTQSSVEISESDQFAAKNFNVDASFIAGFHMSGAIAKPKISGQATLGYDTVAGQQVVRGSVTNNSTLTLTEPVILARGVAYVINQPLKPGDVVPFNLTISGANPPPPALRAPNATPSVFSYRSVGSNQQSVIDILGTGNYNNNITRLPLNDTTQQQIERRRQYFLSSFVDDYYNSVGRGDHVYLAGWTGSVPLDTQVTGANYNSQDTTLYLVQLDAQADQPTTGSVTISPDRFTWVTMAYSGAGDISPIDLEMQPSEEASFRFTPQPDAVLKQVTSLTITAQDLSISGQSIPVYLWNWQTQQWESVKVNDQNTTVSDPARFLGPDNAVQVRLVADDIGGYVRVGSIQVGEMGTF